MKMSLPSPSLTSKKWFRLGFAVILALASSLTLLFLPIAASRAVQHEPLLLSLPFGAEIVRAAGGLTVTKIANSPDVDQGGILTYTIIVTNGTGFDLGPETIIISDTVPANTTCIDIDPSPDNNWLALGLPSCQGAERTAFWVKPEEVVGFFTFPPGAVATMTYAVSVTQPLPDQSLITNLASSYIISAATIFDTGQDTVNTLVNAPAWEISKTANPSDIVEAGSDILYTITYTNIGHLATSGPYTITEQIPISTTYVPSSAFPTAAFDGTSLTWVLSSTLDVNDALAVNFTVTVDDPITDAVEIVNNTYSITGGNVFTPAFGLPVTVTVDSPVTMTVTKSDFPDPEVDAGQLLTYTLTVTNESSSKGPAGSVVISDTLPANTTFVNAGFEGLASGNVDNLGSVVTWTLDNPNPLLINDSASVFVVVRVDSPLDNGTVITNSEYTATADNGTVTILEGPAVTTTVRSTPTLEISKSDLFDPVIAGGLLTYTIRYTNSGNANATNVIITDTFPASTTFNSESSTPSAITTTIPGGLQWSLPSLAGEGGTGEIALTLNVGKPIEPNTTLTNVVSITSSEVSSPSLATETTTITSTPELHIIKLDDPDPVAIGGFLTYTIVYSNSGNADANGVTVTDTLDSRVTFNDASNGGGESGGVVTWSGLSVPADGSDQVLTMSVTVNPSLPDNTILTNEAAIFVADVYTSSTITTLVRAPSLTVTKTVSPTGVVRAGDTVEYTITYTNNGSVDIGPPGINITDTLPLSITNIVSGSTDATFGGASGAELVWEDLDLPGGGGTGTITITGQVITSPWASTGGQITNTVIVAGSGYSATTAVDNEGRPGLPFTITLTAPSTQPVGVGGLVFATATDIYNNPVFDGSSITLTTSLSGSTFNNSSLPVVLTTTGGIVQATISSTVAGTSTLTGQMAGVSSTISDTSVITFTPGDVARFLVTATSPQTAGVAFPLGITAVDQYGNVVDTFNDSATISDTTGTIVPTGATLASGVVTPSVTITRATTPLSTTITVITGTISGTVNVEILPDDPDDVIVEVAPTTIPICGTASVTTTVIDQYLNRIANQDIDVLSVVPVTGDGDVSPDQGSTGSTGFFTSTLQGTDAGNLQVSAVSGALSNFPRPTVVVTEPAIPVSMTLTITPNPLATGGNTAIATVTVFDCLGPSASQVVTFTISNPGLVTLDPITGTTNASGVATTTLTSNASDGTVTITATVGSLITTTNLIINSPVLTITKTASPASGQEVRPGNIINYILQATNSGSSVLTNVVITDDLPTEVTFGSCTSSSGATCIGASNAITVTTSTLGIGQVLTANVRVTVGSVVSGTGVSNQANALSSRTPFTTSNIVTHTVTTATIETFLPIVLKDFAFAPDLIIVPGSFAVTGSNPNQVVTLVVQNVGTASTGEGFWVDFYVNPTTLPNNPALGGNRRWELTGSSQGIAWPVPALAAGAVITLTSDSQAGTIGPSPAPLTQWTGSLPSGSNQLYVFVDSFDADGAPYVEIAESNEDNNMASQVKSASAGTDFVPTALPDLDHLPPRWQP